MTHILSKLNSLNVTVTLQPDTGARRDDSVKLRSVRLFVSPVALEPHATWPDGHPISAHGQISPKQAEALLSRLVEHGFFEGAEKYHSPRKPHPQSAPPEGSRGTLEEKLAREPARRGMVIRVTVNDAEWYTYYVHSYDWDSAMGDLIDVIREPLEGEAAQRLAIMRQQLVFADGKN